MQLNRLAVIIARNKGRDRWNQIECPMKIFVDVFVRSYFLRTAQDWQVVAVFKRMSI